MAPKKKPPKKLDGGSASGTKMPAPKRTTQAEKKSGGVAKKPSPKKAVRKTPTGIKKETKKKSTKATGKAGTIIKKEPEEISDKPAGNTRAAAKKGSKEPTKPAGKSVTATATATATTARSKGKSTKPVGNTSAVTKEPTPELVDILSDGDNPAVSPKRKRKTEDKWTETTDLPVPKSPKLDKESSPSPSRKSREIRTLEDLASEGWDTSGFDREICCIDTVEPCRIPSPFANLTDRKERLMHIVGNHAHPTVCRLFESIQLGGGVARLQSELDGKPPGASVALQGKGKGPDSFFVVRSDKPDFSRALKRENGTNSGISFDVHIRKNAKTGEIGYFAANKNWLFIINEKIIGKKSAAGPLPDFAVIQIDSWTIFWWRTRADLKYIPEATSQDAEEVEEEGATKDSSAPHPKSKEGEDTAKDPSIPPPSADKGGDAAKEPSPPPTSIIEGGDTAKEPLSPPTRGNEGAEGSANESPRPSRTWDEILCSRLIVHHEEQDAAGDRHEYHRIAEASGMTLDDVLLAIATIREPLRNAGNDFAFAGSDVIDPYVQEMVAANLMQGTGVVGEGNVFIMPLFFPPDAEDLEEEYERNREERKKAKEEKATNAKEEAEKGKANTDTPDSSSALGHLLLAVAEKTHAESGKVKIEILDSLEQNIHPDAIRRRAQGIACAWLGTEVEPEFDFRDVPQQARRSNVCGLYVILNAWAIMLDIGPIRKGRRRRGRCGIHWDFVDYGLEIVNLALAGFMDSRTIRAFLNRFGYTDVEEPTDREDIEGGNAVVAVRMDPRRFERTLQQWSLQSSPTTSARSPGSDGQKTVRKFPIHLLQAFLDSAPPGTTLDEANTYLEITRGDLGEAIMMLGEQISQLDGLPGTEPS